MNHLIGIVLVYLFLQMCFVWVLYKLLKNPSVVDIFWPLGLMMSGLIYLCSFEMTFREVIVSMLLMIWAIRLGGYLWYSRIRKGILDKRYTELNKNGKQESLKFFLNFQFQAVLIFIISLIFYFIKLSPHLTLSLIDKFAIIIIGLGILGESLADWQLTSFKRQNQKEVCNVGLWYYSRHPNYFFDWVTWMGFTLFAI